MNSGGTSRWAVAMAGVTAVAIAAVHMMAYGDENEAAGRKQLAELATQCTTMAAWQARVKLVREGIINGSHLPPASAKCPLNPIIHSAKQHDGYTVENVAFESL